MHMGQVVNISTTPSMRAYIEYIASDLAGWAACLNRRACVGEDDREGLRAER